MSNEALEKQRQALVKDLKEMITGFEGQAKNASVKDLEALEKVLPELRGMLAKWEAKTFSGGKTRRRRRGGTRKTRCA